MFHWLFRKGRSPTRPEVTVEPDLRQRAFTPYDDYFVRPDWNALAAWVETLETPELQDAAWWQVAEHWLEALRVDLTEFEVERGLHHLLLSSRPTRQRRLLREFTDRVLTTLKQELADITTPRPGPHVILCFDDAQDYYEYVSYLTPAGRPAGQSGGMFIYHGLPHIALWGEHQWRLEVVLAHELTHDCLESLELPVWLEEGLTQLMEERFALQGRDLVKPESAQRQRRYWVKRGLGPFWAGRSFQEPGDVQELSYDLALFLVRRILEDHRGARFDAFLQHADPQNGGEAAARQHLKASLGQLAAEFLGPGDWTPWPGE